MYIVGKFGGGVLMTTDDLLMLPSVVFDTECNFLVISAFSGQTRILQSVCENCSEDEFFDYFLPFHEYLAKNVGVYEMPSVRSVFNKKINELKMLVSKLSDLEDSNSLIKDAMKAQILAMGEDFSTTIIHALMQMNMPKKQTCKFVDARHLIRVNTDTKSANLFLGADFDQSKTKQAVNQSIGLSRVNNIYITQGFVAGLEGVYPRLTSDGDLCTAVMPFDGSDITAGLLSATLPRRKEENHRLIFFKRFCGTKEKLPPFIGILKLFEFMKKNNVVVVSESISSVTGLPIHFEIREYGSRSLSTIVSTEALRFASKAKSIYLN